MLFIIFITDPALQVIGFINGNRPRLCQFNSHLEVNKDFSYLGGSDCETVVKLLIGKPNMQGNMTN